MDAQQLATIGSEALPNDVLKEILFRLPAKSILRFRAVSPSWHRLLSDLAFLRAYHRRAPRAVLLDGNAPDAFYAHRFDYPGAPTLLPYSGGNRRVELLGSCDGMLLLWRSEADRPERCIHRLCVYNPATREQACLPGRHRHPSIAGFYFHAPTAEYRVLCSVKRTKVVQKQNGGMVIEMLYEYSVAAVGKAEMRHIVEFDMDLARGDSRSRGVPVTLRGCLHWMFTLSEVNVFDTVAEEFRHMRGPPATMAGPFSWMRSFELVEMEGTMAVSTLAADETAAEIWVLQDYEAEAWVCKYRIDVNLIGGHPPGEVLLVHVSDDGDALIMTGKKQYVVYNLERGEVVRAGEYDGGFTTHVYKESLMPHEFMSKCSQEKCTLASGTRGRR